MAFAGEFLEGEDARCDVGEDTFDVELWAVRAVAELDTQTGVKEQVAE